MRKLPEEIIQFLHNQSFVIVLTIDSMGMPHASCKGIVKVEPGGRVYLLDLYKKITFKNLKKNPNISIVAVNEHKFTGYCLKGRAKIVPVEEMDVGLVDAWEARIATRITQRVVKNIVGEKGHQHHPEALLPKPQYLIALDVENIVDLTPGHIGKGAL